MATHSSTLAWKIPWIKEPDRLQSMGVLGVSGDAVPQSKGLFLETPPGWAGGDGEDGDDTG